jgi:ubiquinone/menaquinone biosynthesis C-methylase UbiE
MADGSAFNAFERDGWAQNSSEAYDRVLGPITRRSVEALLDAAGATRGTRVLDLATGPGYVAARAADRGAEVIGADLSPQMLERARRAWPSLRFVEENAEALSFAAGQFDAVVANFLILHLGHPERAAAECARVLAPGGRVALTAWSPPEQARLFGVFVEAVRAAGASFPSQIPAGPDFFRFGAERELTALLESAGFREIEIRTIDFVHPVPDIDDLWEGMAQGTVRMRALLGLQPEPMRRRIRIELDRLLEPYRERGELRVPVSIKLAGGRR